MGTLKKFRAAYSLESCQLRNQAEGTYSLIPCIDYKDTLGNTHTNIYSSSTSSFAKHLTSQFNLMNLIPVGTADIIDDFNINDYSASSEVTSEFTNLVTIYSESAHNVYTISMTNDSESDITINCIKFVKQIWTGADSQNYHFALCYGYYIAPLVIPAGETRTVAVDLSITVGG